MSKPNIETKSLTRLGLIGSDKTHRRVNIHINDTVLSFFHPRYESTGLSTRKVKYKRERKIVHSCVYMRIRPDLI